MTKGRRTESIVRATVIAYQRAFTIRSFGAHIRVSHVSHASGFLPLALPPCPYVARERAEERDGQKEEGEGRLLRNKEPPVDELILPDDSRGYGPAGV